MNPSRYLVPVLAAVIMTSCNEDQKATQSNEPQTPSQKHERTHSLPELAVIIKSIDSKTLPKELRSQSAIQVADQGPLPSILDTENTTFSFPLAENKSVELSVSKVVTNRDLTILFGQLASGQKSHYKLVFNKGLLHSGTFNLGDSQDQYQLTTLENGSLVLSNTDPKIHLPACGCDSCVQ
jgi:hypothetical protein